VRIEGHVERVSAEEADEYYNSRPRGSRLGSWVSPQSQVIPDRAFLEERLVALETEYADHEPNRPPYWGGWLLRPLCIEFWQGAPHRLHDRLLYRRASVGDAWQITRLAP
jgi:pyridoxamine 5'-phosphate oxidase